VVAEALEGRVLLAVINTLVDPLTGPAVDPTKWDITDRGLENNAPAGYNDPTEDPSGLTLGGTTTAAYWYGKSLESHDEFDSRATTTVSVDRASLSGAGTAWRSSLWLLQPGATGQFLHFSQDVNETAWQYNQTTGGVGTGIAAFNAVANDGGEHVMKLMYVPGTGSNADITMYLDGVQGPTAHFSNWDHTVPFKVILTGQGRAVGDFVSAVFKDFSAVADPVPTLPPAAPSNLVATAATRGLGVALSWQDNANNEINFHVERSTDGVNFTEIGTAPGAPGSGGTVLFDDNANATSTKFYYRVRAFNTANNQSFSGYSNVANTTTVAAVSSLSDPFTGSAVDTNKWDITNRGLENNAPAGYDAPTEDPTSGLTLGGTTNSQYWYGSSLESRDLFLSQTQTTVEVDRAVLAGSGTAWRASLWILQPVAGGQYVHFSQNVGENGWQYNQSGTASATGGGVTIDAFNNAAPDNGEHIMKLVYTPLGGSAADVDVYLDGNLGTTVHFTNWDNTVPFKVIVTGQGRATGDQVLAQFKNLNVTSAPLPTAGPTGAPGTLTSTLSGSSVNLQWTDNATGELGYLVERSIDGTNFTSIGSVPGAAGTGTVMNFTDTSGAALTTYFYRVRALNYAQLAGAFTPASNLVAQTIPALSGLTDPFTGTAVDTTKWDITTRGLENNAPAGYNDPTEDPNGLTLGGTTSSQYWYGSSLESKQSFLSSVQTTVQVDRVSLAGSGTAWRSSLWLLQPGGQFLHFSQNVGETGWQYNVTGGGSGTGIAAFNNTAGDAGEHIMKLVYTPLGGTNATVDMYLDGVLGQTINFTNWDNSVPFKVIVTGQARAAGDTVSAVFKDLSVTLSPPAAVSVEGTAGNDTFYIKRNADGLNADVWVNSATPGTGTPTQQVPLSQTGNLVFDGLGGNDTLTVDYSAGSPIPAGGATFNGGDGTDTLKTVGGGASDALGVTGPTLQHLGGGALGLGSGVERLAVSNAVYTASALSVLGPGTVQSVDIGSGATVRVLYSGASPAALIRAAIKSGYAGGAWNGPGINSSDAATHPGYGLGYADANGLATILYTRAGDATLDKAVDFNDLVALAQHYNSTSGNETWSTGDYNYDGNVDFNDLVLLAQNYNTTAASLAASLGLSAPVAAAAPSKPAAKPAAKPAPAVKAVVAPVAKPKSPFAKSAIKSLLH
jgi:hypothetical protein